MPYRRSTYARIQRRFVLGIIAAGSIGAAISVIIHIGLARTVIGIEGELPANFLGFALLLTALAAALPGYVVYLFKRRWQARYMRERGYLF